MIKFLAAVALTASLLGAGQLAKADVPDLTKYAFDLDFDSNHRIPKNYGVVGGVMEYLLGHKNLLQITTQNPDGTFVGTLTNTKSLVVKPVEGKLWQDPAQVVVNCFNISFQRTDKESMYSGTILSEYDGNAYFLAGQYFKKISRLGGGITIGRIQYNGPLPFTGGAFKTISPPK
jgi:hypothetical protein